MTGRGHITKLHGNQMQEAAPRLNAMLDVGGLAAPAAAAPVETIQEPKAQRQRGK